MLALSMCLMLCDQAGGEVSVSLQTKCGWRRFMQLQHDSASMGLGSVDWLSGPRQPVHVLAVHTCVHKLETYL
jgi:hypothetical protein